jgi:hypothetical protein
VLENTRSPATYVNLTTAGGIEAPADTDPTAPPEWRHLAKGPSTRWHDHRAHWMGVTDPPIVTDNPGVEQVIEDRWTVPITIGGQHIDVAGDLVWIPGPSSVPWVALIVGVVLIAVAGAFTRWWRTVTMVVAVVLIGACMIDVYGEWISSGATLFGKIIALSFPLGGFALVIAGLSRMSRKPTESTILLAAGGALLAALFGWASRSFLSGSQLPTNLDPIWSRASVAIAAGTGVALIVMAVIRQRLDQGVTRPARRAGSSSLSPAAAGDGPVGSVAPAGTGTVTGTGSGAVGSSGAARSGRTAASSPLGSLSSSGRQLLLMVIIAILALLLVAAALVLTRSSTTVNGAAEFGPPRAVAVSSIVPGAAG